MDALVYPFFRKHRINFSPLKKITAGFIVGSFAMIWAAVLQHYMYVALSFEIKSHQVTDSSSYKTSGYYDDPVKNADYKSPINVWSVTGVYVLIAMSEIFASVTTLEYAFTKAPKNMRSLVSSVQCFTTAFSAALSQAFTPLTSDPHLVWNYASVAILAFCTGVLFYIFYRDMDKAEDALNMLPTGHIGTEGQAADLERRMSVATERRASVAVDEKRAIADPVPVSEKI
jgi:POT family proton-dependent oligopeptide transporter